jgi:glycosyltransferase involved in cell wall biosynthesis
MFVLVVGRGYPSKKYILNGVFEFDQARALKDNDCKIVYAFVDLRSIRRWRKWGIEHFKKDGVDICGINVPCGRFPRQLLDRIGIYYFKYLYKRICEEYGKPDLIHAHFLSNGYYVANLIEDIQTKFIITEHSSNLHKNDIKKINLKRASFAYKKANEVLAVSPSLVKNIERKLNFKATFVPNIVDTKIFEFCEKEETKEFRVVSVGGLTANKRMDLLIEAFAVFANKTEAKLTIFGEGAERRKIEKLIEKLNMSGKVFLKGLCSRAEISKEMSNSDLFVLVSRAETFGVAYIEAMSSGLPVIATKSGGPEIFVNNSNGILIPVDDLEATVKAIRWMYENINKYNSSEISRKTKEMFSPGNISSQLIDLYEQTVWGGT